MIFKTWIKDLTKVQGVVNNIKNIPALTFGDTELLPTATVHRLSSAINGLNLQQAQLALSTKNLTKDQMNQVLVQAGLIASENKIQAELVQSALAQAGLSIEKQKAILGGLNLMNVRTGEMFATKSCTKEELLNMLATKGVTGANVEATMSALGFSAANGTATISFELLTASIWANIKALATWLITNPVGWCILAGTAILGVVKLFDIFTVSTEEAMESLETTSQEFNDITNDLEALNDELNTTSERIKELQALADNGTISIAEQDELDKLTEENEKLERNIVLQKQKQAIAAKKVLNDLDDADLSVTSKYKLDYARTISGITYGKVSMVEETKLAEDNYNNLDDKIKELDQKEEELRKRGISYKENVQRNIAGQIIGESEEQIEYNDIIDDLKKYQKQLQKTEDYFDELYDDNVQKKISAYEDLINSDIKLNDIQQQDYNNLIALQDAYLMHCYRVQQSSDAYKALNAEQQKSILLDKLKEKGYTDEQAQKVVNYISEDELDNYYTTDFDFNIPNVYDYNGDLEKWAKNFAALWKQHVDEELKNDNETTISSPKSFTEAWASLGKESDEEKASTSKALKESLLELANAGKLTEKAFNQTDGAKTWMEQMKSMGMTTEDVIKEINALAENTKQLDSMQTGIDTITSAYDEKKNSTNHIVSSKTLNNMYDTLGIESWDKKDLDVWERYKKAATDGKKSMSGLKKEQNSLAAAYVNSNNFLSKLTYETQDYYDALLTIMGIENAHTITTQKLNATKVNEAKANNEITSILKKNADAKQLGIKDAEDLNSATISEIGGLISYSNEVDIATTELQKFMNNKILAAAQNAVSDKDLTSIAKYCNYLGICTEEVSLFKTAESNFKAVSTGIHAQPKTSTDLQYQKATKPSYEKHSNNLLEAAQKEIKKRIKKIGKLNLSNGNPSDDDPKNEKSTQTIDWIERRLHNLQGSIDLAAAKLQNLFSVKGKNKNLNEQIKTATKLMNAYGSAAAKYQEKADEVAKGTKKTVKKKNGKKKTVISGKLSDDIINKIKTGEFTKDTALSSLIKEYDEDTAQNIQSYVSWYDKAQDAKKSRQEQRAKIRELQQQKHQNVVDKAQANIDKLNAKKDNASTAAKKNSYLKQQLKWIKQSYNYQIKIADLENNNALKAKLKAEKQKALRDNKIERYQNKADQYDSKKELLNTKIDNSFYASDKNKLENQKLSAIKKNYDYQIKIAKAEGDNVKAATLLAQKYAEILETKKNILQHTLDENNNNRTLIDSKYSNAKTTKEKDDLLDKKIKTYNSDTKAYENNYNEAKSELKSAKSNASSILGVVPSKVLGLTKADKDKIKALIKNGKKIPDNLLKKVKHPTLLQRLNNYNAKVDAEADAKYTYELGKEQSDTSIRESQIEQHQNLANDAEAKYNLNQQLESNANSAKAKNKYEADSRNNLNKQYSELIKIAQLENNRTEEQRLQAELESKLAESYKKEFDNIKDEYDRKTGRIDSEIGVTQAAISALEAQGKNISTAFYDAMIKAEQNKKSELLAERDALEEKLAGLTVDSPDWYDAKSTLDSVSTALYECAQNTAEWQKNINELNMKPFENALSHLQTEESRIEFLINMLSHEKLVDNDTGAFTSEGLATMSLQLDEIAEKQRQINTRREEWSKFDFSNLSEEEIIAKNKDFQESIQSLIEGTAGLKDSIIDLCENALNTQLNSLNDLISKYKDALNAEEDLYQYQKKIKEQTESIARLMKQQAALKGDESEEARARLQQIEVKLKEAEENLEETERQKTIDDINDMLDDLSKDYEEYISSVLDDTDRLIESVEQAVRENPEAIAKAISDLGYGNVSDTSVTENPDGSKIMSFSDSEGKKHTMYFDKDGNYTGSTVTDKDGNVIQTNEAKSVNNDNAGSDEVTNGKSGGHSDNTPGEKTDRSNNFLQIIKDYMISGSINEASSDVSDKVNEYFRDKNNGRYINKYAWSQIKWLIKQKYGVNDNAPDEIYIKMLENAGFSQGGIVGMSSIDKAIAENGDDVLITAKIGERILTPVDSENFSKFNSMLPNAVNVLNNLIQGSPEMPLLTPVKNGITLGDVSINLEGSNVVDFPSFKQEFENELRTDSSFKSMLGNAVTGMMVGEHVNRLGNF